MLKKILAGGLVLVSIMVAFPRVALAEQLSVGGVEVSQTQPPVNLAGGKEPEVVTTSTMPSTATTVVDATAVPVGITKPLIAITPLHPFVGDATNTTPGYDKLYVVGVDTVNQMVSVVKRGPSGNYDVPVKNFIASTGTKKTPTPSGMYLIPEGDRNDWAYFKTAKVFVRYPLRIFEDYFFHSLLYTRKDLGTRTRSSYTKLGDPASHGCIRMLDEEAQWLSENIVAGTMVVIYEGVEDPQLRTTLKLTK